MGNNDDESKLKRGAKARRGGGKSTSPSKKRVVSLPLDLDNPEHRVPGSISRDAELARKALEALPGLSKEQLAELRTRIDSGYYKNPKVVAAITEQIARIFSKDRKDSK